MCHVYILITTVTFQSKFLSKCFLNIECESHNFRTPAQFFDKFGYYWGTNRAQGLITILVLDFLQEILNSTFSVIISLSQLKPFNDLPCLRKALKQWKGTGDNRQVWKRKPDGKQDAFPPVLIYSNILRRVQKLKHFYSKILWDRW